MTIKALTIECTRVANITPFISPQGEPKAVLLLEDVPMFELITSIISQVGADEILKHITNHDMELHLKGENNE